MFKKILAAILFALALVSCGGGSSSNVAPLSVNIGEEGKTLDPQLATSESTHSISTFIQEGLTRIDRETKAPAPGLAESWDVSEDGLVWTFHLRDNLKWSNGDALTANDFKFAWMRALDPNIASEYAYMLFPIKNAEEYNAGKVSADEVGIKVLDDKTLEVTLKAVTPYFTSLTAFITYTPANEKFIKEVGEEYALEADKLIYSGPYKIVDWTHNSEMKLEKNENYYNADKIVNPSVKLKFIADQSAILNAFKNDELDVVRITAEQYEEFKNDEKAKLIDQATIWYLQFNHNNPVLKNANIRKALLMAIDKEELVKIVSNGINEAVYNLTPKGVGMPGLKTNDFPVEVGESFERFNAEKAKELLAEGMKELGITSMPAISIILNDSGNNKKMGEVIQENLRTNLGVEINIELMAFKERIARMHSNNFDIVLAGWGADYQDPLTFLDLFVTGGGNNNGKYSNPEYDKAVKIAQTEPNPEKRFEALKRVEQIVGEDVIVGVLMQAKRIFLVNPRVSNYQFYAIGASYDFTQAEVK